MQVPAPTRDFAYFDGTEVVHADPLAIYRKILIITRGKPNELANKVFGANPDTDNIEKLMESWEAAEQLVALVRDLFNMKPFDPKTGQGARDEHCWTVWDAFCETMSDAKKKTATLPTTSSPTEAMVSSQPTLSTSA